MKKTTTKKVTMTTANTTKSNFLFTAADGRSVSIPLLDALTDTRPTKNFFEKHFNSLEDRTCLIVCQKSKVREWFKYMINNYTMSSCWIIYNLTNKEQFKMFFRAIRGSFPGKMCGIACPQTLISLQQNFTEQP